MCHSLPFSILQKKGHPDWCPHENKKDLQVIHSRKKYFYPPTIACYSTKR